jgi:hypothetical protein
MVYVLGIEINICVYGSMVYIDYRCRVYVEGLCSRPRV